MRRVQKKFTHFLFLFIAVVGVCSTMLLLNDPLTADIEDNSEVAYTRLPSSLASDANKTEAKPEALLNIQCNDTAQKFETANSRIRLKADSCAPMAEDSATTVQVQNKSNGYVATIFHRGTDAFSTDYINLNEGSNQIELTLQSPRGPITQNFEITRNRVSKN